jgi:thiamine biosynthesis lipoprotein
MKNFIAASLLTASLASTAVCQARLNEVREVHYQMGTVLDITVWHPDVETGKGILRKSVQEVRRLDKILSNYDPSSGVSLLNDHAGRGRMKIDPDLFRLLFLAQHLSAKTRGYFDVTVGPLVALWQHAGESARLPASEMVSRSVALVGSSHLKLYGSGEAELLRPGMKIDLGGIGKGYAVDRIAELLKKAGVGSALINFGTSSIYALGSPPGKDRWEIAVRGLHEASMGILSLKNQALSTSGSMGRYWTIGGTRYGHLINPKNGFPINEERFATVVAATATEAEALTKPLILLDKKGVGVIKDFPQADFLLISQNGDLSFSDGFVGRTLFRRVEH